MDNGHLHCGKVTVGRQPLNIATNAVAAEEALYTSCRRGAITVGYHIVYLKNH